MSLPQSWSSKGGRRKEKKKRGKGKKPEGKVSFFCLREVKDVSLQGGGKEKKKGEKTKENEKGGLNGG